MKKLSVFFILLALFLSACISSKRDAANNQTNQAKPTESVKTNESSNKNTAQVDTKSENQNKSADNTVCLNIKVAGKKIDAKQTFAFDFEPFKNACFVTAHDPEFDNPPLGSEFYIYKDGKQIYQFPSPFNGVTTGCWAEGVAFQDLNEDGLTDIIIAGMCSAKTAPYSENMVYVNKATEFTTNEEANYTLEKFKKIKDIADFVKRNKEQFFQ